MKISTFLIMLVFIGVVLFIFGSMTQEGEEIYNIDINDSWSGEYNYADTINSKVEPIQQSLLTIEDEEAGWLEKIGAGFTGVIAAVTFIPRMLLETITLGGEFITGTTLIFGLPSYIVLVLIIILLIWGIFRLLEIYQGNPI